MKLVAEGDSTLIEGLDGYSVADGEETVFQEGELSLGGEAEGQQLDVLVTNVLNSEDGLLSEGLGLES